MASASAATAPNNDEDRVYQAVAASNLQRKCGA
jgi:hypothetical protein